MHAQKTTTPAQANEAVSPATLKIKRNALMAILPDQTPVQAAIRAVETHRREVMEPAYKSYEAAEMARNAAQAALEALPLPAELVVTVAPQITDEHQTWPFDMVFRHPDGREVIAPINTGRAKRLETRESITAYFGEDHPNLQERLAAFDRWETEAAPLRRAVEKAQKAEEKADRAWQRSYELNDRLCRAILEAPAAFHEAAIQVEAYSRLLACGNGSNSAPERIAGSEEALPMVAFMHRVLKGLETSPTPDRAGWNAAMGKIEAALDHESETSAAWDEASDRGVSLHSSHPINVAWEEADTAASVAIDALLDVTPPDAAALAEQIRAFSWLEHETHSEIAGGTGWALDVAAPAIAAAIDAGSEDLVSRRLLTLYRHAVALGGRPATSPRAGYFRKTADKLAGHAPNPLAIAAE